MKIKKIKILGFITVAKIVSYNPNERKNKIKLTKKQKLEQKIAKLDGNK